ncbi:MAG: carboxypeptidase-like regulatory domain-containing protein [Chloracidobacterium sp.]|nr:carboxypeptidase-like regulatory domain-containing protein [Chloracidobacterium sp.]MDW8217267.1 carboxypeptidase-like regulatory domain-containing protein [Acidobacteriota bacterium]
MKHLRYGWMAALGLWLGGLWTAAEAQFSIAAGSMTVRGRVLDAQTRRPLVNAQVNVRTQYDDYKTLTDAEGYYTLQVTAGRELREFELIFSHPDYREKYFHTAFQPVLRADLTATVEVGRARVKYQKNKLDLPCGDRKALMTRGGDTLSCTFSCEGAPTLTVRLPAGNEMSVAAANGFSLKITDEKVELRGSENQAVTLQVTAVMFKR